jgi:uncharacterized membrane protein
MDINGERNIMACRNTRERLVQGAGYELGGFLVAAPACAALTGNAVGSSMLLVIVLTLATVLWAPLFNTAFDRAEWKLTGRVASDRCIRMRLVHAFALEASDTVISVPILMALGGLDLTQALIADLGLLGVYMAYTYAYHTFFDWARPVRSSAL